VVWQWRVAGGGANQPRAARGRQAVAGGRRKVQQGEAVRQVAGESMAGRKEVKVCRSRQAGAGAVWCEKGRRGVFSRKRQVRQVGASAGRHRTCPW